MKKKTKTAKTYWVWMCPKCGSKAGEVEFDSGTVEVKVGGKSVAKTITRAKKSI